MQGQTLIHLLRRLKTLRMERDLTQEQFAEASGISYKYYQAVEAGRKKELRLSTLERLAHAHGIAVWELLAPNAPRSRASIGKRPPRRSQSPRKK